MPPSPLILAILEAFRSEFSDLEVERYARLVEQLPLIAEALTSPDATETATNPALPHP